MMPAPAVDTATNPTITISRFEDFAAREVRSVSAPWHDLVERIKSNPRTYPNKRALPWIKLARFGSHRTRAESLRHDANVESISGIEVDYDAGNISIADAATIFAEHGVAAFLYSTPSYTEERPRWRALCPTSHEMPPAARAALVARVNGIFGGVIAAESFTLSQAYYVGRVDGVPFVTQEVRGSCIDLHAELDDTAIARPVHANAAAGGADVGDGAGESDADLRAIIATGADGVHRSMMRLAARNAGRGMDAADNAAVLFGLMDAAAWRDTNPQRWQQRRNDIPRIIRDAAAYIDRREPNRRAEARAFSADDTFAEGPQNASNGPLRDSVPPGGPTVPATGAEPAYSEGALSAAFLDTFGRAVRFVPKFGKWLLWDSTRWKRDESRNVFDIFDGIAQKFAEAAETDPNLRSKDGKHAAAIARSMRSARYRNGGEQIARTNSTVTIEPDILDVDPFLLNTPGGTYDLRTGEMIAHNPALMLTRCTKVAPGNGTPVRFLRFVDEITCGDTGLAKYLQRAIGACAFGADAIPGDHWMLFMYGTGRNGKNTLMDLVVDILGDYAMNVASTLLMADEHGSRHTTEVAQLHGSRLALASELNEGARWHEARIKGLTGDAMIRARFMRQDDFTFKRTHRIVVLGNHKPILANPDPAMAKRLHLIPFNANFSHNGDPTLPQTLRAESADILSWIIRGADEFWQDGQLRKCAAVEAATDAYFEQQSVVDQIVEEIYDTTEPSCRTPAAELYRAFKAAKEARGEGVPSQTRWGEEMMRRFKAYKSGSVRGYIGVRVIPAWQRNDPF